jgi:hypothetical protein
MRVLRGTKTQESGRITEHRANKTLNNDKNRLFLVNERMSCLYTADPTTGHFTRIGTNPATATASTACTSTAESADLNYCGGRFGVTPDSNGQVVYDYPVKVAALLSHGCDDLVTTHASLFALYLTTCGSAATVETVTTVYGPGPYACDCPCYDANGSNVVGKTGRPANLAPVATDDADTSRVECDATGNPFAT